MKFEVRNGGVPYCHAEGKHGGYVVTVFGRTDLRSDRWRVEVYLQKLGESGQAATTGTHKLDTTNVSAGSADEVFELGFAMAEREIDSYTKP